MSHKEGLEVEVEVWSFEDLEKTCKEEEDQNNPVRTWWVLTGGSSPSWSGMMEEERPTFVRQRRRDTERERGRECGERQTDFWG